MAGNTNANNQRAGSSRRKVLVTMAGASLSAMATKGAEAQGLTAAQIANFNTAYQAFNSMASIPKAQSLLWTVLDPQVSVFKVVDDTAWTSGICAVIDSFYALVITGGSGQPVGPTFNPIYNGAQPDFSKPNMATGKGAQWVDTDGSLPDLLKYTFKFNGNLLQVLHAR